MSGQHSCLVSHDYVLTVSLSAKCLFCVETPAFLAENRPPLQVHLLAVYLLTVKRLFLWLLFCGHNGSW